LQTLFMLWCETTCRVLITLWETILILCLLSPPLQGIQTTTVAPGGAVITEFKLDVPGNYTLVDHALARAERGLLGILSVEGAPNPDIYNGQVMPGMGH